MRLSAEQPIFRDFREIFDSTQVLLSTSGRLTCSLGKINHIHSIYELVCSRSIATDPQYSSMMKDYNIYYMMDREFL